MSRHHLAPAPLRRVPDEELFDPSQFKPGHDSLTDTQIARKLDELNPPLPEISREMLEEVVTRVDPAWCERFDDDLALAASFYQRFAPEAFEKARKEIGA
jgi:hypothetical protein